MPLRKDLEDVVLGVGGVGEEEELGAVLATSPGKRSRVKASGDDDDAGEEEDERAAANLDLLSSCGW